MHFSANSQVERQEWVTVGPGDFEDYFDAPPPWAPPDADPSEPATPGQGRRRLAAAGLAALVFASGGLGAAAAQAFRAAPARPSVPASPNTLPGTGAPFSSGGSSGAAGGALDASAVAAKVEPAVVDITSHLADQQGIAAGTGMLLAASGEVLTNNHVIEGASDIHVQVAGAGPSYTAHVVGYDVSRDVALLQLDHAPSLPTVRLGRSSNVSLGSPVVAIGNALGQGGAPAVTQGVVMGLNQSLTAGDPLGRAGSLSGLIEGDAPLQEGDSGGPLVNAAGEVIGMNTAAGGLSRRSSQSSVGFAIPIDTVMTVVRQIRSGQRSATVHIGDRAVLGVLVEDPSAGGFSGGSNGSGARATVASVQPNSPAASAGLTSGDVITEIGTTTITSGNALSAAMNAFQPGDHVQVGWVDPSGQHHTASVQLIAGPPA